MHYTRVMIHSSGLSPSESLLVGILSDNLSSQIIIYKIIMLKDVFDYFGDALGPRIWLLSARRVVHAYDNIGDTLVAHTSSL